MKKSVAKKTISIARGGEDTVILPYKKDETLEELLERADITLGSGEEVFVESNEASMEDVLDAGDLIQIVGKKDGGIR